MKNGDLSVTLISTSIFGHVPISSLKQMLPCTYTVCTLLLSFLPLLDMAYLSLCISLSVIHTLSLITGV